MRYFTLIVAFLMLNLLVNHSLKAQKTKVKTKNDAKAKAIKLSGAVKYVIHKENIKNQLVKTGDFISFHIEVKNSKDSILGSSYTTGTPALQEVMTDGKGGGFEDVLLKLHKGDSATVWVNSDSLAKKSGQPLPAFIAKGSDITYMVKIIDIMNKAQAEEMAKVMQEKQKVEQDKKTAAAGAVDEKIIKEYIIKNNLKAENIGNGIYYVRNAEGTGATPVAGDNIKANYTGKTLDGNVFDSSLTTGRPFEFAVGTGMVIRGWDEGFLKMKKGEKGVLLIPSAMAYGAQSPTPAIKPFSVLLFEVELVDFTKKVVEQPSPAPKQLSPAEQSLEDEKLIKEYITTNKIKATRTPSGLYISKSKTTKNAFPKAGDMVKVHYTGKNLKGEVFDSSVERGTPFEFTLGRGQVIRGWDEGIGMLKKGEKGLLLIPSGLAYGASSQGAKIPANAVLIFEVELF